MKPTPEMSPRDEMETWEMRVQQAARNFTYPPTPDIARRVRLKLRPAYRVSRMGLLARVAVMMILIFTLLMTVPEIRAGILEILRIGAVSLFPYPSTATPAATIAPDSSPTRTPHPTVTPVPTPLLSILDLPGETTLEAAREQVNFPIRLPAYPENIGRPDRVFSQQTTAATVTLVWLEDTGAEDIYFALAIIGREGFIGKFYPWNEQRTTVNGHEAAWLTEPHEMYQEMPGQNQAALVRRIVEDFVLIWVEAGLTYRLETDLPLEEARKIAESLR